VRRCRRQIHDTAIIRPAPSTRPSVGEATIAAAVLKKPLPTSAPSPALASAAPASPPISACEDEEGMPNHQVMTFQAIAPTSAPNTTTWSATSGSMMPLPTVLATCRPKNRNAMKLKNAAQITASRRGATTWRAT